MSFAGRVEAQCPGCSERQEFEVWAFVRGDQDESLREQVKAGELNLLECPGCGRLFYAEASWVYADPGQDLVAFVFPQSYGAEEEKWRGKMAEDFECMRPVAQKLGLSEEPILFFGGQALAELMRQSEDLADEADVARWYAERLGLSMRLVGPAFARRHALPRLLPSGPAGSPFSREAALSALRRLLHANDHLEGYRRWIEYLEGSGETPPFAGGGAP